LKWQQGTAYSLGIATQRLWRELMRPVAIVWSRWIQFLSVLLIVYGLVMVFAPQMMNSTLVGPLLFYHTEPLRSAFTRLGEPELIFLNVLNGLIGTVTIGYAILIGWMAYSPFRKGETWVWNAIAVSLIAWAMLEVYVKLVNGLGAGSMAHLGLLVAFGIPLLATYRDFHPYTKV
jgi:hypothetical protein